MTDAILVLNAGSSSIKFGVFDTGQVPVPRKPLWSGKFDVTALDTREPYRAGLDHIRERVLAHLDGRRLAAVVHRVVHGGSKYFEPVQIDANALADLKSYIPLAPLHQPFALDAIEALHASNPDLPQIACFDTAFHHTMPKVEQMLPLSYTAWERGLRRYGFHGLSYEYMSIVLAERYPARARGRTIGAHLGSGASLCAMLDLISSPDSQAAVAVEPTNEEWIAAVHGIELLESAK